MEHAARRPGRAGLRRRRHVRYALWLSTFLALTASVGILPVFRDRLQGYLGIDDRGFGLLFGLGPLVGVAGVVAAGVLLRRVGPVAMIRWALQGTAAGMLLLAAGGRQWLVALAGCVLCALWAGPLTIAASAYLTRLFPRDQRRILAFSLAVGGAAGIVFPLAAEGLLWLADRGPGFGPVFHFPFLLLAGVLAGASFAYRGRRPAAPWRAAPAWSWRLLLVPLPVAWLAVLIALHGAADTALFTWMPRFLGSSAFPARLFAPGLVLSAFSLAYLVARALLAALPDAWGRRALLVLPGLAGGSVLLLGILSRSYLLTAAGYVLGAFLWSAEFPAMLGTIARRNREHFGLANALSQVLGGPLLFVFVNGAGLATYRLGEPRMWLVMLALAGGFVLVGLGGAWWLARFGASLAAPKGAPR